MVTRPLSDCIAFYVDAHEAELTLGDNRGSGRSSPWKSALRIIKLVDHKTEEGTEEESDEQFKVRRFYTIRPARFPNDRNAVKTLVTDQNGRLEAPQYGPSEPILLACIILADGRGLNDSIPGTEAPTPGKVRYRLSGPSYLGCSADLIERPEGGYRVRFNNAPQAVLEEQVVGLVSVHHSTASLYPLHSQNRGGYLSTLYSYPQGQTNAKGKKAEMTCNFSRLYVKPEHRECVAYALVDTMINYTRDLGYTLMTMEQTLAPGLEYAENILKKAGPDPYNTLGLVSRGKAPNDVSLKSPNPAALKSMVLVDNNGNAADVLGIVLAHWPGPLDAATIANIKHRRRRQQEDALGGPTFAEFQRAQKRSPDKKSHSYEYNSLEEDGCEIRLLRLRPGLPGEGIHIDLHVFQLFHHTIPQKVLKYDALSYCWGSADDRTQILVGDSRETLDVTHNLAEALSHLREPDYPDEPRYLWVDAICVNQGDLQERCSQVKRMADIFQAAYRKIVWLGPGTLKSTEAMKILQRIGCTVDIDWYTHRVLNRRDSLSESLQEDYMLNCTDLNQRFSFRETELVCLLDLLIRPWFERLWIWQEIRLNTEINEETSIVQFGPFSISWQQFSNAIFLITQKNRLPVPQRTTQDQSLFASRVKLAYRVCDIGIEDPRSIFEMARYSKCSNDRDRVYALLSLFDTTETPLKLEPNYHKTAYWAYREAVLRMLLDFGRAEILAGIELREDSEPATGRHWSSWVPDWSRPRRTCPLPCTFAAHTSRAEVPHHGDVIHLAGVAVTEIQDLCAFDAEGPSAVRLSTIESREERYKATQKNLLRIFAHFFIGHRLPETSVRFLCRTLVAGKDATGHNEHTKAWSFSYLSTLNIVDQAMMEIWKSTESFGRNIIPPSIPSEEHALVLAQVLTQCEGRSICMTPNGSFALVPSASRRGDIVAVLLGCNSPMVLRPTNSRRREHYRIVGEAYCDGFMDGQALLGPLPQDNHHLITADVDTSPSV